MQKNSNKFYCARKGRVLNLQETVFFLGNLT